MIKEFGMARIGKNDAEKENQTRAGGESKEAARDRSNEIEKP